jgi:hypothetical protein
MKEFDSFYFLHIPKTAGRYFTHNVVVPVAPVIKEHGIHSHYNRDTYIAHQFWADFIDEKTYVVSLLRDPVQHLVSLYSHYSMLGSNAQHVMPIGSTEYDKNSMFDWLVANNDSVKNIQSKNFLISSVDGGFIYSPETRDCIVTKDIIFDKLKDVSLLIKSEELSLKNTKQAYNKILSDLGVPARKPDQKLQSRANSWNPDSTRIYATLTEKEKEKMLEFNSIDAEVYNTQSLFYNFKESENEL